MDPVEYLDSFDILERGSDSYNSLTDFGQQTTGDDERIARDFAEAMLVPFIPELMDVNVEAVDDPEWWQGKTLSVPETHHFQYDFDFGSYDEAAPDDAGIGTLMKYYLLKGLTLPGTATALRTIPSNCSVDIRDNELAAEHQRHVLMEYIVFFLGLWLGLFIAIVSIGTCFLKQ